MVAAFVTSLFGGGTYAALHWRYDRRDFLSTSRCAKFKSRRDIRTRRDTSILTYQMACHLFLPILERPDGFAGDIVRVLSERGLKRIYIAAPPSEKVFVDDLMVALKRRGIDVLTYQHVAEFFDANYANCQHFKVTPFNFENETEKLK